VEDTYKKVSQIEHILLRPDTYIGSVQMAEDNMWVLDQSKTKFEFKKIKFIPGLYKIFD
jgi:DNA topoisomerase-2